MTHRAEQIIDAVVVAIKAQPDLQVSASNIYAHRTLTLADDQGEMPAITVNAGDDAPASDQGSDNLSFIDSTLVLSIISYVIEDTEELVKQQLFDHRRRVHQAIMLDDTIGLSFVIACRYGGAAAPEMDATSERVAGSMESHWNIFYRMNFSDPGA
jgi:hypothetical protein